MHWYVGIDEAGYGPSLGPFVMALTAVGFPQKLNDGDNCWDLLSPWISRGEGRINSKEYRLIVGDSKKINSMTNGLSLLGKPWRTLFNNEIYENITINDFLEKIDCIGRGELFQEFWWIADEPVKLGKIEFSSSDYGVLFPNFKARLAVKGVKKFNQMCRENGSKSAVTAHTWTLLVRSFLETLELGESVSVITDKQGGRNRYGGMISDALGKGEWVIPERENANESDYRVLGTSVESRFRFVPRAESACPTVALASMLAKHLREESMQVFNKWWLKEIPELSPTAGYPGDAPRFIEIIRPVANRLGIAMDEIVRVK